MLTVVVKMFKTEARDGSVDIGLCPALLLRSSRLLATGALWHLMPSSGLLFAYT